MIRRHGHLEHRSGARLQGSDLDFLLVVYQCVDYLQYKLFSVQFVAHSEMLSVLPRMGAFSPRMDTSLLSLMPSRHLNFD
jgi:hypothetical protein